MRHLFPVVLLLKVLCFSATAQQYEYVPFPTENAVWKSDEFSGFCDPPIYYCYSHVYSTGDELIINDTTYIGIYGGYLEAQVGPVAAMRVQEDSVNHRVFLRSVNNPHNEVLLYDFDLEVGDTLPFVDWGTYESNGNQVEAIMGKTLVISMIDTVSFEVDGSLRKRFHLDEHSFGDSWSVSMTIIEGIGATAGLGVGIDFSEFEHSYQLQCLRHHGDFIFGYTLSEEALEYYYQFGYQYCAPPVGIGELGRGNVLFYPNPMEGNRLFCDQQWRIHEVAMWNMMGEAIPLQLEAHGVTIQEDLPSGIYLLRIELKNTQVSYQRIVKP
jgi:hypothetical protein